MDIGRGAVMAGLAFFCAGLAMAQQAAPPNATETLHTTTQLVVLDATVFDRHGEVVTTPLGRDDFEVTEDRRPQTIRYFEAAAEHEAALGSGTGKAPLLIVVLDELNFPYNPAESNGDNIEDQMADFAYMRHELIDFLQAQPAELKQPLEVLVLTHHGYQVLVQPTRVRETLIDRVRRRDPGLGTPFRDYLEETGGYSGMSVDSTLTKDSLHAVWSLALEERGVPGRKIVLWLGYGGPNRGVDTLLSRTHRLSSFESYVRELTNLLVDARVTLDLFRPGIESGKPEVDPGAGDAAQITAAVNAIGNQTSIGFTGYVRATGGEIGRGNDVTGEMNEAVNYGDSYYTLSYAPREHEFDGRFQRIRVTVKGHPDWVVLTKAGYYALQYGGEKNLEQQVWSDLTVATYEAMPFSAIGATLRQIERVRGTEEKGGFTARFVLNLESDDLQWHLDPETKVREAEVAVSAATLGNAANVLTSKAATWKLTAKVADATTPIRTTVSLELRVPAKTRRIRFVVRDLANGRMGTTDVGMRAVEAAPAVEEEKPTLQGRAGAK